MSNIYEFPGKQVAPLKHSSSEGDGVVVYVTFSGTPEFTTSDALMRARRLADLVLATDLSAFDATQLLQQHSTSPDGDMA